MSSQPFRSVFFLFSVMRPGVLPAELSSRSGKTLRRGATTWKSWWGKSTSPRLLASAAGSWSRPCPPSTSLFNTFRCNLANAEPPELIVFLLPVSLTASRTESSGSTGVLGTGTSSSVSSKRSGGRRWKPSPTGKRLRRCKCRLCPASSRLIFILIILDICIELLVCCPA